jgi:transposase
MTVKEVAKNLSCSPETVKGHIRDLFPGLMRNGKTTYLTPPQVTIILERIQKTTSEHRGAESVHLQRSVVGIETALTPALRLEMLYRQIDEIKTAEIERLKSENTRLQIRADENDTYLTVKRVAKLNNLPWASLDWKRVRRSSQALELEWRKADDLNYGTCNAYHIDAWRDAYPYLKYPGGRQ